MIDLTFEKYTEAKFTDLKLVETYELQLWMHHVVAFEGENIPSDLVDPEALLITNQDGEVLQVILREEGCDSPLFQFTENEKEQLKEWFNESVKKAR
ncbi:hypothetical protein RYX56_05055 [Alkalihalophilus lindianensis]|uniref:Uncharacterized protein n=1 Tax=Alkalihalophilus lindianensis TaxID=1630542 RepID=A0ABU3X7G3_9BACI|nr:hypothetical protein [Alkalihalophilus lindianensis]MDV2683743.1 hypothetical protein [Alkalihalophilus lindianensis]